MRIVWVTAVFAVVGIVTGCASIGKFDSSEMSVRPDSFVVALSVNTAIQEGKMVEDGKPHFGAAKLEIVDGPDIQLSGPFLGLNLIILEVPGPDFDLGNLFLFWESGGEDPSFYQTATHGPSVKLIEGSITYIGSLLVTRVEHEDASPSAASLVFMDDWDQDVAAWGEHYPVVLENPPIRQVSGDWGGEGVVALRQIDPQAVWATGSKAAHGTYRARRSNTSQQPSRIQRSGGRP